MGERLPFLAIPQSVLFARRYGGRVALESRCWMPITALPCTAWWPTAARKRGREVRARPWRPYAHVFGGRARRVAARQGARGARVHDRGSLERAWHPRLRRCAARLGLADIAAAVLGRHDGDVCELDSAPARQLWCPCDKPYLGSLFVTWEVYCGTWEVNCGTREPFRHSVRSRDVHRDR